MVHISQEEVESIYLKEKLNKENGSRNCWEYPEHVVVVGRKRDQFTVLINSSIPKAKPYLPCISMGKHNKLGLLLGIEKIVEGEDYWGMPYQNELKRKYCGVHIEYSQELPRSRCWKEFEQRTFSRGTQGLGNLQWNGQASTGRLQGTISLRCSWLSTLR